MKKKNFLVSILFLLSVLFSSCSTVYAKEQVKLDAEHFPDPVFRSWMSQWDYGWTDYSFGFEYTIGANDGILSDIEIARINILNPIGSSLKGIEYLSALGILVCPYLNLSELDISKNSKLTFLDCKGNKLIKLDVFSNDKLKTLKCNSNDLSELNLKNNTYLNFLDCSYNHLTELDLENNQALTTVYCQKQVSNDLKVKITKGGYEVNLKDYVSKVENIDISSIKANNGSAKLLYYDGEAGIVVFNEEPRKIYYLYKTHSPQNTLMDVTIKKALNIAILGRGSNDDNIIYDIKENSYINQDKLAIKEKHIVDYPSNIYGKEGFTADGNSRLILRVQTENPGIVTFSFQDNIGATLENLTNRKSNSTSSLQIKTS